MLSSSPVRGNDPRVIPTAVEQECWSHALECFESNDFEVAAMHFRKLGARSRVLYNVAVCYLNLRDEDSAMVTFERAQRCDPYFSIAQFQLAFIHHQAGRSDIAINVYNSAINSMRGNSSIDYAQLGLDYTLYVCELYYNMAAAQIEACDTGAAMRSLVLAHQHCSLSKHEIIDHAMVAAFDANWALFEPPVQAIFRVKKKERSWSIGSSSQVTGELPSTRLIVNVAEGEIDRTTAFMAPVHKELIEKEVDRAQELESSSRGLEKSLSKDSLADLIELNNKKTEESDEPGRMLRRSLSKKSFELAEMEMLNLAKVHLMDPASESSREIVQSRILALDEVRGFEELLSKLKAKFKMERIKLKYLDAEGDFITMCDEADLAAAYDEAAKNNNTKYKLSLWCYAVEPRGWSL